MQETPLVRRTYTAVVEHFVKTGRAPHYTEIAATLGFLGLFTLVFGWSLARHDAVPLKDPALATCLEYHT